MNNPNVVERFISVYGNIGKMGLHELPSQQIFDWCFVPAVLAWGCHV